MISRLRLQNWRSYVELDVSLALEQLSSLLRMELESLSRIRVSLGSIRAIQQC